MQPGSDAPATDGDPSTRLPLTVERIILAACMATIALITAVNVLTRYLTNISLAFTEEFCSVLMVVVTFAGSAYAFAAGRHVRVDYFIGKLTPPRRARAEIAAQALIVLMLLVLIIYGARMTWDNYRFETLSAGSGYPEWLFVATLPVFGLLALGRVLGRIWRALAGNGPAP